MSGSGIGARTRRERLGDYLLRHNVPSAGFVIVTIVSGALSVVFSGLAGASVPDSLWFLLPAAVVTALGPLSEFARGLRGDADDRRRAAAEALLSGARADHDQRRYEQFNIAVKRALMPLSDYIGRIAVARPEKREALIIGMGEKVVQALNDIIGKSDEPLQLRSAYYELEDGTLVRKAWDGRPDHPPRDRFVPRSRALQKLLPLVRDDRIRRIDDNLVAPAASKIEPSHPGDYRAVICCGVKVGKVSIGLLSVDTPIVGAFTGEDEVFIRALAKLFGAALVLSPRYQEVS